MTPPFNVPLSNDDLMRLGVQLGWHYGIADQVRFGELDALGHVNNTAYLRWFENVRIRYFHDYGLADCNETPPRIVLKSTSVTFHKEMLLHEAYIITGRTHSFRTTSFRMEYAIWAKDLRATGDAVLVWLNHDGQKTPLPDHVRTAFATRDGARDSR